MASIKFYLDTRRIKNDGTYPVKLRVKNKKVILVPTEMYSYLQNWDGNCYNGNEPGYKPKNIKLWGMLNKVETMLFQLETSGKLKNITDSQMKDMIVELLSGKNLNEEKVFVMYMEEFTAKKTKENTQTIYSQTKQKIEEYDPLCTLESINKKWLTEFETWMTDKGLSTNTRHIHFRNIRAVFNFCIDNEYTTNYPFRNFRLKTEQTRKRNLTVEQLRTLRDYPCEPHQVMHRDMFMLMFYLQGINAIDLFTAKKRQVVNGRLEYRRAKTGKLYSVLIQPEAKEIIKKYKGKEYLLSVCESHKNYRDFAHRMNKYLGEIGKVTRKGLGGKKYREPLFEGISSYWARHSWATIAANIDIPFETISAALGHSYGAAITNIYIDFSQKKVDDANRKVIDFLNQG